MGQRGGGGRSLRGTSNNDNVALGMGLGCVDLRGARTDVFPQRNDCICNVKPICDALFLLHAPRPRE